MRRIVFGLLLGVLLTAGPASAQSSPLEGRWKLNVAKSTYTPDPPPRSQMLTWKRVPGGFQFTTESVSEQGQASRTETLEKDDGSEGKVTGGSGDRTRFLRRVNTRTYEDGDTVDGAPTYRRRMVISPDGKTMTITVSGVNGLGQPVNNIAIYDKQ